MAAPSSNRRMTIILVVGGVLVALLAAYNLLGGGGDDSGTTSDTIPPAATTPSTVAGGGGTPAAAPAAPAPAAPALPNQEFDVFATRNPFEPAIQVVSETTPIEDTPAAGGVTPTEPAPTEPPPTGSPEPTTGTTVALLDVFDQGGVTMARIQVGSTQYTVAAGQTFAVSYKVVSLSGTCGQFLYGDSPFSLCENEQITK
jgi:hypothetical protein